MQDWAQGTALSLPWDRDGFRQPSATATPHRGAGRLKSPPAAAAGQENPGGGLPWEGTSLLPTPAALQPPQGPRGIPGEGAEKQVFVNSFCHMHEKHQALQRSRA